MRLYIWVVSSLVGAAGISAVLAQTIDGLDVQSVRQRGADLAGDAQAFVDQVKDRGDAFREEAAAVRETGTDNMRQIAAKELPRGSAGAVDFDEIVQGAAGNASLKTGDAPQFIVFASLSMPAQSLKPLIRDTARAGGVVVFRGFPDNSMKAFTGRIAQIVERQDDMANIGIDPRLFRAFDVQAVPTFVAVSSDFDLCAGFSCRTRVPPHDRMVGNVTVVHALSAFADGNGPGARIAGVGLSNLRKLR